MKPKLNLERILLARMKEAGQYSFFNEELSKIELSPTKNFDRNSVYHFCGTKLNEANIILFSTSIKLTAYLFSGGTKLNMCT